MPFLLELFKTVNSFGGREAPARLLAHRAEVVEWPVSNSKLAPVPPARHAKASSRQKKIGQDENENRAEHSCRAASLSASHSTHHTSGHCRTKFRTMLPEPATPSPIEGVWKVEGGRWGVLRGGGMACQSRAHVVGLDRERDPGSPTTAKPLWYQPDVIKAKSANRMSSQRDANFLPVMGRRRSPTIWGLTGLQTREQSHPSGLLLSVSSHSWPTAKDRSQRCTPRSQRLDELARFLPTAIDTCNQKM